MSRRPAYLLLSAAAWLGFVVVTVWTIAFLAGVVVPTTVDGPDRTTTARAVAIDLALLLFFAVQHSVMARRQVKSWLSRRIPKALERTSYVLATDICLALLLVLWQPWGEQIWHAEGSVAVIAWSLFAAGWALAITATFAIDHLELLGLRQAGWASTQDPGLTSDLYVGGLYAFVRHPLMTGLVLAFWSTPRMGASHLLFALAATGYIAVGIRFEERDLRKTLGASYDDYAARVPALLPRLPIRRGSVHSPDPSRRAMRRRTAAAEDVHAETREGMG
jgi:protein-S-isoprenylcysteine O-methyltransferase Ste14